MRIKYILLFFRLTIFTVILALLTIAPYISFSSERDEDTFNEIIDESRKKEIADDACFQLLNFYFQKKKYSQVVSLGKKWLKDYHGGKSESKVYFYLGETYYLQGNWEDAIVNYKQALEKNCGLVLRDSIYRGLGLAYLAKGDKIKAKADIDKIENKELRLFSQGVYYSKTNNHVEALEILDFFIINYPQSEFLADAYLNKADLLYEMGRLNDSISLYKHIMESFKTSIGVDAVNKARYDLAWCYLKKGKFSEAIEEFERILEYTDDAAVKLSSRIQIADAYQEISGYDKALDIYNNILKSQPNTIYTDYIQFQIGMTFLKKKDLDKASFVLKNLKNDFPSSKLISKIQYHLAAGYFSQEYYGEAKNLLEDFIDKFSHNNFISKAYYLYGKCFFNEKNYEKALSVFKKIAGKCNDKEIEEFVYIDIGSAYLNLSLFNDAEKVWKDFLNKYPYSQYTASVALYLGELCEKEEDYAEAEKYYRKAVSSYKESSLAQEALFSLGRLYWIKGDLNKARNRFEKLAGETTPLALKGKLYLAKILARKGKNKEALVLYDQLTNSESSISKIALIDKAFLYKKIKDYGQAIVFFKEAVRAGVNTPEEIFSLGLCLEKAGRNKEAIEEYFKVIHIFLPEEDRIVASDLKKYKIKAYFRIAKIYEKENNTGAAKDTYNEIISLGVEEAKIAGIRLKELDKD